MPTEKGKGEKEKQKTIENAGVAGANVEVVDRFGSAVKQHSVAYKGVDNETGQVLKRGLKSISESKINPQYREENISQQAGFSAEVETAAQENAEKIIRGEKAKVTRTDDMAKQSTKDGQTIGGTNDQLYDLAEISPDGTYIEGTARQLKYVGSDAQKCCDKLLDKKYDKYREADATIEIPKDFYDEVQRELDEKISEVNKQLQNAEAKGNTELAAKHRARLEKIQKTKDNLRQGRLTKDEAIEARLHPKLYTAKNVAKLSHRAGLESAKMGAAIGGGMSFIRNSVSVIKGDEEPGEAALAITKDTASAAALSYTTGFLGSAIKGGMQNASSSYLRVLSNTGLPAFVATTVLETGKTMVRFAKGEIDGVECLNELGEKGSGVVASTVGAAVGQAIIPIPILGGLVGSMCGYALSSMYYNTLTSALNEAKLAHEERLRIEAECEEAIAAIREFRLEMEIAIRNYFTDYISAFNTAFSEIQEAFDTQNIDGFIAGANAITEKLGKEALFHSMSELDGLMAGDATIVF